jgi:signal transduction histidine kinase/ligand-binding sensor domain-containing protein
MAEFRGMTATAPSARGRFEKVAFASVALLAACGRLLALDSPQTNGGYVRKNFTVEDGLLSNSVAAVVQTSDGFLWAGTNKGLLRFDGRHFTAVNFPLPTSPVSVRALAIAPDGALWVGTSSGVARIASGGWNELGHVKVSRYHPGVGEGDSIECLHFSRKGELFVGTTTGLYRFKGGEFSVIIPELWTSRIEESASGNLLVITSKGFVEWDGTQVIRHPDLPARLGVRQNEIFHVIEDRTGTVWYCTKAGIARQSGGAIERLKPYGADVVYRASEDLHGSIWFSQSGDLFRANAAGRELIASHLQAKYFAYDRDGDLWAGTTAHGLFRLKLQAVKMFTATDGLPLGMPAAVLAASDGKLWVGSNCGGLSWFDGSRFRKYEKDGIANICVFSLAEDGHDILVGTFGGGIFRYREGRFTELIKDDKLRNNIAMAIVPGKDGSLWIPFTDGLSRLREGRVRRFTTADGLSSNSILSAYSDQGGVIWVETAAGIDRFDNGRFIPVSNTDNGSIREGQFGFGEDQRGELFAFSSFDGTRHVQKDGVATLKGAPKITGMVKSRENLWFCGDGIYRAASDSLEKWEHERETLPDYARFGRADGMNSAACSVGFRNMAITADGRLWVATEQGVAMLEPSQLRRTDRKPAVFIESVVVGKTLKSPGAELVLPAGTHHVELHFDSIELASPEAVRMQYRLDDVDREWLDADSSVTAIYGGLPGGTHTFHVRASNSDGVWDPVGIAYNVTQKPYFYETLLFRLGVIASLALLLAVAHQRRLRRITTQMDARLDERVAERTRLARDLHDTMLQTIQASELVAAVAVEHADDPVRTRATLKRLSDWLAQARQEARASLLALRVSSTLTNDLAEALELVGAQSSAAYPIQFSLLVEGNVKQMHPIVRDEIYLIGSEAIRNACTHSGGTRVEVALSYAQNLGLRVRDNGKGMDPNIASKGKPEHYGLTGMQERAARISGKLTVSSSASAGTEVELVVPARIIFRDQRSLKRETI